MDRDKRLKSILPTLSGATQAIRTGLDRTPEREHSEPIFTTSSFVFPDAAIMADAFMNNSGLSIYGRVDNPTVDGFCKRLAVMERAEACEATADKCSTNALFCMHYLGETPRLRGDFDLRSQSSNIWKDWRA